MMHYNKDSRTVWFGRWIEPGCRTMGICFPRRYCRVALFMPGWIYAPVKHVKTIGSR